MKIQSVQPTQTKPQVTVVRRLGAPMAQQQVAPLKPTTQALGTDRLLVKPKALFTNEIRFSMTPPKERTWQDYQKMLQWTERVTGKPTAYQTPESQHAYIKSIQGKPQEHYDTTGFLKSIGVERAQTYGRDDAGVHSLLKTIKYTPNSEEVSLPLRLAQKAAYWTFLKMPKVFNKLGDFADKHFLTKKDMKQQSWINMQVPQPGIHASEPLVNPKVIQERYGKTVVAQTQLSGKGVPQTQAVFDKYFAESPQPGIGVMFEGDFHMGVPEPDSGEQNYGSYAIAKRLGFSHESAARIATANFDTDLNVTEYGKTDAFPDGLPSRHFNLNKKNPQAGDTRFIWAQRHLDAAVALAKRGRFEQAEKELGYGLHGIQDAFAHGHIRLASHAITDNIPDGVDYNPIGAYEATVATVGYLNKYIEMVLAP